MSVSLQPSSLLADHLQVKHRDGFTVFKFTVAAQERLEDLLKPSGRNSLLFARISRPSSRCLG